MENKLCEYDIELINIYKSYNNNEVFKNLNMNFLKNKVTVILGPSGSGKTTLLNLISGIEKQDKGDIILKNNNISYIFQEDRLIPWLTVYENIAFVLKSNKNKKEIEVIIDKYLYMVKLTKVKHVFPKKLSGGMKRRVSIARAFAYNSEILLMDEPFKGLDYKLKNEIIKEFLQLCNSNKKTVILVTHDMQEAKVLGDKIYNLE